MTNPKYAIRRGVAGPGGEAGILLIAPPSEALDWDVAHEVTSTCCCWMPQHQAWWIAVAYLATAQEILDRAQPRPVSFWVRLQLRTRLLSLWGQSDVMRGGVDRI